MKVAVFNVSHWHFPLYLPVLHDPQIEVVGVSDNGSTAGARVSAQLGCALYEKDSELLAVDFDFAIVLSPHRDMAAIAEALIARKTPFLIEKPCGLNLGEVQRLRRLAEDRSVHVSVPFIIRVGDLAARLSPASGFGAEGYQQMSFRFVAGPIGRYEAAECAWMLDRRQAGGGSAINLGVHFIDMFATLTGETIVSVSAQTSSFRPDIDVEEYSIFTCRTRSGRIGIIETGYLYPSTAADQRDFSFSISHRDAYIRGFADQLEIKGRLQSEAVAETVEYNTDAYYSVFVRRCWDDLANGRPPVTGLREAEHAIAVIEAGYRSASNGGAQELVEFST